MRTLFLLDGYYEIFLNIKPASEYLRAFTLFKLENLWSV